jgi:3-deoxy-manno-octulosonate cytidylyltransferase (CMP-KDO synthetase)
VDGARVLGVVPARLSSTRFPRKVLAPIGGKPLVVHAYERLSAASEIDDVLIATDSREVEAAAEAHGARAILVTEPCATGSDRVARAVEGLTADIVVNLQADHPTVDPGDVDRLVESLRGDDDLDLTTLAWESSDPRGFANPDVVKVVRDERGRALYFSRAAIPSSRSVPLPDATTDDPGERNPLYLHHVGIYCFRREALSRFAALPRSELEAREGLEQLRALAAGMAIGVLLTDRAAPNVDRPEDLPEVETRLAGR